MDVNFTADFYEPEPDYDNMTNEELKKYLLSKLDNTGPQHVSCRCGVPTKEELWRPVFFIVYDYEEVVKEHAN